MSDIEIIHECIINRYYENCLTLSMELSKVDDEKLIVGLLIELSMKNVDYKINDEDKQEILKLSTEYLLPEQLRDTSYLKSCHDVFREKLIQINKEKTKKAELVSKLLMCLHINNEALFDMILERNSDFKEGIKHAKEVFLKEELYEWIGKLDKHL